MMLGWGWPAYPEGFLRPGPFLRWSRTMRYVTTGFHTARRRFWVLLGWGWQWRRARRG